jgi:hypothetical protein
MDFNKLIFTSSDYLLAVSVNGVTAPISILESFDYGAKKEMEVIHRIGSDEPAGVKSNASTYPGKIQMEAGELEIFLKSLGFVFATQIIGATVSVVTPEGDIVKVFRGCVFGTHDGSVKAKDKRSLISIEFMATSVDGI